MRKPKQETKLVTALYPRTEREIVISFDTLTREPTPALAMTAWKNFNQALIDHKDIKIPPFLNARFSRNNFVLTTGLNHNNMDYEAYLPIICHTLTPLEKGTAHINERWTKFITHGVPTTATMDEILWDIETQYPNLKLAQVPSEMVNSRGKTAQQRNSDYSPRFCGNYRHEENRHIKTMDSELTMQDHRVSPTQRSNPIHELSIVRSPNSSMSRNDPGMRWSTLPKQTLANFHSAKQDHDANTLHSCADPAVLYTRQQTPTAR
jgi:hypothetical protein